MALGTACGKIILFGEHAVVYGRPALAVPLSEMRARARVESHAEPGITIHARDLGREIRVNDASSDDPLAAIVQRVLEKLGVIGDLDILLESDIPLASGLGSGAAISTAIVRAIATHFDKALSAVEISALVYETEKLYHGTPSGIDNTVIAFEQPIRFQRQTTSGEPDFTAFQIARPFTLLLANTGIASLTKRTVGDVRRGWERERAHYENIFDAIAAIVEQAQDALARGENERLGELMSRNQRELEKMGVSSPEIEKLIQVGLRAGAGGGKLSGGGRGGNVIFYLEEERAEQVRTALVDGGASSVIITKVGHGLFQTV